jgi:hypothetical protein
MLADEKDTIGAPYRYMANCEKTARGDREDEDRMLCHRQKCKYLNISRTVRVRAVYWRYAFATLRFLIIDFSVNMAGIHT